MLPALEANGVNFRREVSFSVFHLEKQLQDLLLYLLLFLAHLYKSCTAFIQLILRGCGCAFKPLQGHRKSKSSCPLPTAWFALGGNGLGLKRCLVLKAAVFKSGFTEAGHCRNVRGAGGLNKEIIYRSGVTAAVSPRSLSLLFLHMNSLG